MTIKLLGDLKDGNIELPIDIIPKDYIGEKFGVLLVWVKGEDKEEMREKVKLIKKFCKKMGF